MLNTDEVLVENEFASLSKIRNVNFKPHPYTVGASHVIYASDHNGGMLDESVMRKMPCAHHERGAGKCLLSYEQHTSDRVCFVSLKRDVTKQEIQEYLQQLIADGVCPEAICDGFAFVNTGFTIQQ